MNTAVRAHRILTDLPNFRSAERCDGVVFMSSDSRMGQPIGIYCNSNSNVDAIQIFSNGLIWSLGNQAINIFFKDILDVVLANGKESKILIIESRGGEQFRLPINGQRDRFFDSLVMLRFLDRVKQDLLNAVVSNGDMQ